MSHIRMQMTWALLVLSLAWLAKCRIDHGSFVGSQSQQLHDHGLCEELGTQRHTSSIWPSLSAYFWVSTFSHKQLKDLMLKMMLKNCSGDLEAADCALKTFTRDQPSSEGTGLVQAVPFGWLEASQHLADCASWLVQHTGRSLSKDKHLLVAFVANKLARSCSKLGVKWNQ